MPLKPNKDLSNAYNSQMLVFDFDGVMTYGSRVYYEGYKNALKVADIDLPDNEQNFIIDQRFGSADYDVLGSVIDYYFRLNVKDDSARMRKEKAVSFFRQYYLDNYASGVKLIPGCAEQLGRLSALGYRMALATAAEPKILKHRVLPKAGIQPDIFQGGIATPYDVGYKPDPYTPKLPLLEKIIKSNVAVSKDRMCMVGDSANDFIASFHAGIPKGVATLTGNLDVESIRSLELPIIYTESIIGIEKILGRTAIELLD